MRAPDLERGPVKAWKVRMPAVEDLPRPDMQGTIRCWLVTGPFHPFWSWWMVCVIHLRPIEGVPDSTKHYSEAEYEFQIVSINPDQGAPDVDAVEAGGFWGKDATKALFLTPADACIQFHGVNDLQAANICDDAVGAIIKGAISPDSDFRRAWAEVIPTTVAHYAAGLHEEPPE